MDIKILGRYVLVDDRTGQPVDRLSPDQDYLQNRIMVNSWSSQEWKSGAGRTHDRSGKPEENSWDSIARRSTLIVKNIFSAGNAHSARYEETDSR